MQNKRTPGSHQMNRKQNDDTPSIHSALILDAICSSHPLISKIQKKGKKGHEKEKTEQLPGKQQLHGLEVLSLNM